MSFEAAATLLLPAGDDQGRIQRADERWRFDRGASHGETALIWGREPTHVKADWRLARSALSRERALASLRARPPQGLSLAAAHRWVWGFYRPGLLPTAMGAIRSGLLVELKRDPEALRAIDAAARDAGAATKVGRLKLGEAGFATTRIEYADRSPSVFKAGPAGSLLDPARTAKGLRLVQPLGLPCVPVVDRVGRTGDVSWSAESLMPGATPRGLTAELFADVASFVLSLPRAAIAPTAFGEDVRALAARLPQRAAALLDLFERHEARLSQLPSVLRHGDLWTGNLLVERGRLSGVVDWDAWHPAAVPGTDLLHIVGVERARTRNLSVAEVLLQRPWDTTAFQDGAAGYWKTLGIDPSAALLQSVGIAWWAGQVAQHFARIPLKSDDEEWVARQVDPVLDAAL